MRPIEMSMHQEIKTRALIDRLYWRLVESSNRDEWLVYPSNSADPRARISIGSLTDVSGAMKALGWIIDPSRNLPFGQHTIDYLRCESEVRFMLRLWDVFPTERLVELLRFGLDENDVINMVEQGIDPELLIAMKDGVE